MAVAQSTYRDRYTNGRLTLGGLGPWTPLGDYLDALYVIILETPVDEIQRLEGQLAVQEARLDPIAARENWGATPEQQGLGGRLMEGG